MHWTVTENVARLVWSRWQWSFDLTRPQAGLQATAPDAMGAWQPLQIEPVPAHACTIEDSFARGSDLMVRYGQSEQDRYAFQLDLRAVTPGELGDFACGWDIWLSVQTQLLDSHPALDVISQVPGGIWHSLSNQGHIVAGRQPTIVACQASHGYAALLVHPSDQSQSELQECANASRIRMFGNFMEKGVIRRGRLRCLVGPKALPAADLQRLYSDFAASPLPLTT